MPCWVSVVVSQQVAGLCAPCQGGMGIGVASHVEAGTSGGGECARGGGNAVVLGKFGLVWFGPVLAKPETEPFNFHQTEPKLNPNRSKPFQTIPNRFKLIKKSYFKLPLNRLGTVWVWFKPSLDRSETELPQHYNAAMFRMSGEKREEKKEELILCIGPKPSSSSAMSSILCSHGIASHVRAACWGGDEWRWERA
ncbi:hypothetical protein EDB89DRAFT_1905632 [Lactarius sanguifluus]|nr:hypothetical protein EDB89DRAFT_1905632 [Lactarius sanguifluus]